MNKIINLPLSSFKLQVERQYLLTRLKNNNWNKQKTAIDIGIQRSHLYNLLTKYRIKEREEPHPYFLDEIFELTPPVLPAFDYTNEYWAAYPKNPFYYVSNFGRVKTVSGIMLNITCSSYGYPSVSIFNKEGKSCHAYTYRMAAETFIPNPENKPMVNHINRIKTDSRIENLEWVTASENVIHSINTKLGSKPGDKPVSKNKTSKPKKKITF